MADLAILEQWYYEVPIVTRTWATAIVATALLVQCDIVSPYLLFFDAQLLWDKREVRRPPPARAHAPLTPRARSTGGS